MTPIWRHAVAAALAATLSAALVAPPASAGQYDYYLTQYRNYWYTRNVNHDYSYIRAYTFNGATTCVRRNDGLAFCANWDVSHSYHDSCNPSACLSYSQWYGGSGIVAPIDVGHHDEWR